MSRRPSYTIFFERAQWDDILRALKDVSNATKSESRKKRIVDITSKIEQHFSEGMERQRAREREASQRYRAKERRTDADMQTVWEVHDESTPIGRADNGQMPALYGAPNYTPRL